MTRKITSDGNGGKMKNGGSRKKGRRERINEGIERGEINETTKMAKEELRKY